MYKVKVAILKQYNFETLFIKFFKANTEFSKSLKYIIPELMRNG